MDSSSLSHTKWKCQYHIVFIPKYRRKVLYGKIKIDVREILKKLCKYKNVEIIEGAVCADHVHLCGISRRKQLRDIYKNKKKKQRKKKRTKKSLFQRLMVTMLAIPAF